MKHLLVFEKTSENYKRVSQTTLSNYPLCRCLVDVSWRHMYVVHTQFVLRLKHNSSNYLNKQLIQPDNTYDIDTTIYLLAFATLFTQIECNMNLQRTSGWTTCVLVCC